MIVKNRSYVGYLIFFLFIFCVYLFIYLPLITLIVHSFNASEFSMGWEGFSLIWYKKLFRSAEVMSATKNSLFIAATSTIVSIILGTMFVLGTSRSIKDKLDKVFYPNLFIPDILLAIGLLSIFKTLDIPRGFVSLIIGHSLISLVFVIPIIRTRLMELNKNLIEASLDLGADYLYTMQKIILPLLKPALITSSFMAFTLSLDDFFISLFCAGNDVQTLSLYVFSHLRCNISPTLNALSSIMIFVSILLISGYSISQALYSTSKKGS